MPNSAVEAVNSITSQNDSMQGMQFPEVVSYHKDADRAKRQHERLIKPRQAAARRVAVAVAKRDEVRATRKRLGDELLAAKNSLAEVEARALMGEADEADVRKAEVLVAKLQQGIGNKRDRLNRLAFSLEDKAVRAAVEFVKARHEEACARWVADHVRLDEALQRLRELAAEVDALQAGLKEARREAFEARPEKQAAVGPERAYRGWSNRAIRDAVRECGANGG